ncbi:MAG: 3-phosphoglycerate dehydrogenase family protein [Bacilli bacterium]|nr:3-phosphoglycerate dehydrogenase family protein [Bacilli bacterium]
MKAYCLNKISPVALKGLKAPDIIVDDINAADSILVRSQAMHEMTLGDNILAVARAGAGVNNIPFMDYANKGVVVFNTPGANANAVKELVLCGLFLGSRDVVGGSAWVNSNKDDVDIAKTAEKAKSQFAGHEILGKTIAVIGLGAIGLMVANACVHLGMNVKGYDPYLTVNNAVKLSKSVQYVEKIEDAIQGADYVTIHVPLLDSTKGMLNAKLFKDFNNTVLLNFARDTLVNEDDLLEALKEGKVRKYVTDFANPRVVNMPNTLVIPHLGASTEEAEDNCAFMAIDELKQYLENGSITHSVNYPDVSCGPKESENRVCVLHKNIPGIISKITTLISSSNSNIVNFINKSRGEYAYSVFDVDGETHVNEIANLESVIKVRVI